MRFYRIAGQIYEKGGITTVYLSLDRNSEPYKAYWTTDAKRAAEYATITQAVRDLKDVEEEHNKLRVNYITIQISSIVWTDVEQVLEAQS